MDNRRMDIVRRWFRGTKATLLRWTTSLLQPETREENVGLLYSSSRNVSTNQKTEGEDNASFQVERGKSLVF